MKLDSMKVDSAKIEQGAWVDNIPEMGDLRLRVRGFGNTDYRRLQAKLIDAVPRAKKVGGRLDPAEQDRVMSLCLQGTILVDWGNLTGAEGEPLPYSREQAAALINDPDMRRFRDAVIWAASIVADEQAASNEEDAGNS